jgi:hypothetical protein
MDLQFELFSGRRKTCSHQQGISLPLSSRFVAKRGYYVLKISFNATAAKMPDCMKWSNRFGREE